MLRDNPDLALTLLAEARTSSDEALPELRALARGIHPPVLGERGLDGAVRALTLSLPLPVDLYNELPGCPCAPVESAACFAIAQALANVVKHSARTGPGCRWNTITAGWSRSSATTARGVRSHAPEADCRASSDG